MAKGLRQRQIDTPRQRQGAVGSFRRAIIKDTFLAQRSERLFAPLGRAAIAIAASAAPPHPRWGGRPRMARRDASHTREYTAGKQDTGMAGWLHATAAKPAVKIPACLYPIRRVEQSRALLAGAASTILEQHVGAIKRSKILEHRSRETRRQLDQGSLSHHFFRNYLSRRLAG